MIGGRDSSVGDHCVVTDMGIVLVQREKAGRALGVASNCRYSSGTNSRRTSASSDETSQTLPPILTEDPIAEHLGHRPRDVSDHGRGEEPNYLRRPERWHFAVVSVQQHQPGHALGLGQCPVNGRWAQASCATRRTCSSPSWVMTASTSPT